MYDTCDITDLKPMEYDQLYREIYEAVRSTQLILIRPYPHILLVRPDQFEVLRPDESYDPWDDLLWKNKDPNTRETINVMDIHVKGIYEPKQNMILLG